MPNDLESRSIDEFTQRDAKAPGSEGNDDTNQQEDRPAERDAGLVRVTPSFVLPLLPVRGLVLFPGTVVPLTIGRPSALKLIDTELPDNKQIGLVAQRSEEQERPGPADLYEVGVSAQVLKLVRQPDGTVGLFVQAQQSPGNP